MFKTIYNYFGWLIEQYLPEIKHFAWYFNQEFDVNQVNSYPAIYLEVIPVSITDLHSNNQLLILEARLHLFVNVHQSFTWKDVNKSQSGDYLDLFDRINSVLINNNDVPTEYLKFEISAVRRTGINILPTTENIKEGLINFQFNIIDNSLTPESIYVENEQNNLEINYDTNNI